MNRTGACWAVTMRTSKAHRCEECGARSYYGRPGLHANSCIPHLPTCSQHPSPGQRQALQAADEDRRCDLAHAIEQRLAGMGYTSATARFGVVSLDADDAARLMESITAAPVER